MTDAEVALNLICVKYYEIISIYSISATIVKLNLRKYLFQMY